LFSCLLFRSTDELIPLVGQPTVDYLNHTRGLSDPTDIANWHEFCKTLMSACRRYSRNTVDPITLTLTSKPNIASLFSPTPMSSRYYPNVTACTTSWTLAHSHNPLTLHNSSFNSAPFDSARLSASAIPPRSSQFLDRFIFTCLVLPPVNWTVFEYEICVVQLAN